MVTHVIPPADINLVSGTNGLPYLHHEVPAIEMRFDTALEVFSRVRGTVKWKFRDGAEVWTFKINPDSMTAPYKEKNVRTTLYSYGRYGTIKSPDKPRDWQFSGVIRSQAEHDALDYWYRKDGIIQVTDHLFRTFEIIIQSFEVEERPPTQLVTWRMRYTMKCLLLRQLS